MAIFAHDIFDTIRDDHRKVMDVFDQLLDSDATMVRQRGQLLHQLQGLLLPHMAAEENLIYPILDGTERGHHRHLHADEEHIAARHVLDDLLRMDVNDERFTARCEVLKEQIRLHVAEEESTIFLSVRTKISNQETIDLVQQFENYKNQFRGGGGALPKAA